MTISLNTTGLQLRIERERDGRVKLAVVDGGDSDPGEVIYIEPRHLRAVARELERLAPQGPEETEPRALGARDFEEIKII